MKICILGEGILGNEFKRMNYTVLPCNFTNFDVENLTPYDVIINTCDYDSGSGNHISDMIECNVDIPLLVSNYCKHHKKRYVHISTSELYTDITEDYSTESSSIAGTTPYLASKLLGESVCNKQSLIIRLGRLYNSDIGIDNGLYRAIINSTPSKNDESYVWSVDAIRSIIRLLKKKKNGIFNVASNGVTNQANICNTIGISNIAPTTDEASKFIKLDTTKLNTEFLPMDVMDNISLCFDELKAKLGEEL